eukprot:CAMPEP_0181131818 /NCGR_PEP_ID=MMETSP1071-20121207/30660_1 /TAXON_ID=35127 /ORGANISM="Thalassiosira sp., Strain NH16" /LENGTH=201 /DNA_ID=CAMNT_0023218101 /DNA_START=129 /DNA_END=733 /DNA_ORIENTATION=-
MYDADPRNILTKPPWFSHPARGVVEEDAGGCGDRSCGMGSRMDLSRMAVASLLSTRTPPSSSSAFPLVSGMMFMDLGSIESGVEDDELLGMLPVESVAIVLPASFRSFRALLPVPSIAGPYASSSADDVPLRGLYVLDGVPEQRVYLRQAIRDLVIAPDLVIEHPDRLDRSPPLSTLKASSLYAGMRFPSLKLMLGGPRFS